MLSYNAPLMFFCAMKVVQKQKYLYYTKTVKPTKKEKK